MGLYGFEKPEARALQRDARNRGLFSRKNQRLQMPAFGSETAGAIMLAKVGGTALPAATEAGGVRTVGKGNVTLQVVDDDDDIVDYKDDADAAVTVEVMNWSLEDSGTNTYVWICQSALDGNLYYVNEPC